MHAASGWLGVWLQARQDARAVAHTKQWSGVGIMGTWAQHFCWYFLQKCVLKELLDRSYGKVGYNCQDVVGADMVAGGLGWQSRRRQWLP